MHRYRPGAVGLLDVLVRYQISFVLFPAALFAIPDSVADARAPTLVAEVMLLPTAVLATAVITALVASWMASWLGGDGRRTDLKSSRSRQPDLGGAPRCSGSGLSLCGCPLLASTCFPVWHHPDPDHSHRCPVGLPLPGDGIGKRGVVDGLAGRNRFGHCCNGLRRVPVVSNFSIDHGPDRRGVWGNHHLVSARLKETAILHRRTSTMPSRESRS